MGRTIAPNAPFGPFRSSERPRSLSSIGVGADAAGARAVPASRSAVQPADRLHELRDVPAGRDAERVLFQIGAGGASGAEGSAATPLSVQYLAFDSIASNDRCRRGKPHDGTARRVFALYTRDVGDE